MIALGAARTNVAIYRAGSGLVVVRPLTEAAREWIEENVQSEEWQWLGPSLVVEWRTVENLIAGMIEAGLEVTS